MPAVINKQNDPGPDLEPVFYTARQLLALSTDAAKDRITGYLSRRVVRQLNDLQAHTARLQFYLAHRDTEGLYGALLDLYLVLGNKGRPLRERLLRQVARYLRPLHRSVFLTHLANGVKPQDRIPYTRVSVLAHGVSGTTTVLLKRAAARAENKPLDPLVEVRELIDSGRIEQAQGLLERLVMIFPHRSDICDELLAVYRSTRNQSAFSAMWTRVKNKPSLDRKNWLQLSQYFATRTN